MPRNNGIGIFTTKNDLYSEVPIRMVKGYHIYVLYTKVIVMTHRRQIEHIYTYVPDTYGVPHPQNVTKSEKSESIPCLELFYYMNK